MTIIILLSSWSLLELRDNGNVVGTFSQLNHLSKSLVFKTLYWRGTTFLVFSIYVVLLQWSERRRYPKRIANFGEQKRTSLGESRLHFTLYLDKKENRHCFVEVSTLWVNPERKILKQPVRSAKNILSCRWGFCLLITDGINELCCSVFSFASCLLRSVSQVLQTNYRAQ